MARSAEKLFGYIPRAKDLAGGALYAAALTTSLQPILHQPIVEPARTVDICRVRGTNFSEQVPTPEFDKIKAAYAVRDVLEEAFNPAIANELTFLTMGYSPSPFMPECLEAVLARDPQLPRSEAQRIAFLATFVEKTEDGFHIPPIYFQFPRSALEPVVQKIFPGQAKIEITTFENGFDVVSQYRNPDTHVPKNEAEMHAVQNIYRFPSQELSETRETISMEPPSLHVQLLYQEGSTDIYTNGTSTQLIKRSG